MLKPRVLRNVTDTDLTRSILGHKTSAPFFISPAAMARLVHKDGELALARAAGEEGIIQCVSSLINSNFASCTPTSRPAADI